MLKADVRARLKTSAVWSYGLSVVSVAVSLATTYLMQPYVFRTPLFFLAIMISTWVGGTGPGLIAVLLSTLCIRFFLNPQGVPEARFHNAPNMAAFLLASLMVGAWSAARRRAEDALEKARDELEAKVRERTADLSRTNEQLQKEVNERKRAEEGLREREELMRVLTENANDFIRLHDIEGLSVYGSPSVERLYGRLPTTMFEFAHPGDIEECQRWWETVVAGDYQRLEWRVRDGGGRWRWLETAASRFQFKGQARVLTVCRDITERKLAEEMLHTFSQRLVEAQEAERRRVARELHDEIGQALTAIKINLQAVQHSAGASPLARQLNESAGIVDRALQQVRDLSFNLRPSLLDDLGLIAALRWYVDREARRAGLIPEFVADLSETRLPLELETACFRITQEALTNVVRHAQARRVWVELRQRGAVLHLTVRDDGIGFDVGAELRRRTSDAGLGLQGMQERVLILNGKIEIKSAPSRGAEIHVWFALPTIPSSAKNERG